MNYPTEEVLELIKNYDITKRDVMGLIELLGNAFYKVAWRYTPGDWTDVGFIKIDMENRTLELHTGGWSGNEDIVEALQQNVIFWALYWQKSERGGHYYFTY